MSRSNKWVEGVKKNACKYKKIIFKKLKGISSNVTPEMQNKLRIRCFPVEHVVLIKYMIKTGLAKFT